MLCVPALKHRAMIKFSVMRDGCSLDLSKQVKS